MSQLSRLLEEYAVPLQLWLTPGARAQVGHALIAELGDRVQIHPDPLSAINTLAGPAVVVITAAEIRGPQHARLMALSRAAHPGKAVLVGGTADRDTLMTAINDWGVMRVTPNQPDTATLVAAIRDAEATLKREVALVTAIDDLDIETTMLSSAIDHINDGAQRSRDGDSNRATTTFAAGLSSLLEQERSALSAACAKVGAEQQGSIQNAITGIRLLGDLVDEAHDRAIEAAAGLTPKAVSIDALVDTARTLITLLTSQTIEGQLGCGATVAIDPLALLQALVELGTATSAGPTTSIESHRSGETIVISFRFKTAPAEFSPMGVAWSSLSEGGACITADPTDAHTLRLIIPAGHAHNA